MAQATAPVRGTQGTARVARVQVPPRPARHLVLVPADPRARELRARHSLQLAIAQSEATYELARRTLIEFEEYLSAAKARLRAAGYPV